MSHSRNGDYLYIPDSGNYSVPTTGTLEICFFAKPDTFDFETSEEGGWIDFLSKQMGKCEWAFRLYNNSGKDPDPRPKRMSFYVFNEGCGLGTGSYFQDNLKCDEWIFVDGAVTGTNTQIYKNTDKRDEDYYAGEGAYATVTPKNGGSPVTVGTAWDNGDYLKTGFFDLRIYNTLRPRRKESRFITRD